MAGGEPAPVFADTTALVALFNKDDPRHDDAVEAVARLGAGGGRAPPVVFTDYIFDEVVTTLLLRARRHELCIKAGRMLLEGQFARMVEVGPATLRSAWDLFTRRPDKRWSFTDCTSFRMMVALALDTALTFDSDFEAAGFKTIP